MPNDPYVPLEIYHKISIFTMDAGTGKLTLKADVPASGGPSKMAISPEKKFL